ncbi:hypothetical protein [Paenibacillus glycanilyticus]|uniref:DUF350 domain-containing protein n=1 Tax=Paenibacillus glycanilyticus TaxID=126569 RepID=A0ABQ6GFK3_9BACL|nr:hypothetical protein [Paenibacillus glycanilyticus]GLX69729.1 hypothetical protein MU1_40750 [Paenibacillus glycanilyticus]
MAYFYLCAAVTLISAAVSFGFSINAFLKAKKQSTDAFANSMYAMSRSFSLVLASVIPLFYETYSYLLTVTIAMICVQVLDGFIGIKIKDTFKTIGPFATAAGNGIVLILLLLN